MGTISVDSTGLAWLGAECRRQAADIVDSCAAPVVSGGFSATSAAVRALHSDVAAAAGRIASRMHSTGLAASSAASAFAATEANNEQLIYEI